jgi:hypothetical protein
VVLKLSEFVMCEQYIFSCYICVNYITTQASQFEFLNLDCAFYRRPMKLNKQGRRTEEMQKKQAETDTKLDLLLCQQ